MQGLPRVQRSEDQTIVTEKSMALIETAATREKSFSMGFPFLLDRARRLAGNGRGSPNGHPCYYLIARTYSNITQNTIVN